MAYEKFPNQTGQNWPVSTQYQTHPGSAVGVPTSPQYGTFPEGIYDQFSLSFNGSTDYMQVADSASISQPTDFTLCAFFTGQAQLVQMVLWAKWRWAVASNFAVTIGFATADRVSCFMSNVANSAANHCTTAAGTFPNDGLRKHLAIVYTRAGATNQDKLKIYINGVDQTSTATYGGTIPALNDIAEPLELGRWRDGAPLGSVPNWAGEVDSALYYNRPLSGGEIASLAAGGAAPGSGLVSSWPIVGGTIADTNVTDTLAANPGTLLGSAAGLYGTRIRRTWRGTTSSGRKVCCGGDSITAGTGWAQIGQASGVGGYRVELYNHIYALGKRIDYVGAQSSGPTYLNDTAHEGVSGQQINNGAPPHIQSRLEAAVASFAPDIFLICGGTNDIITGGQTGAQTLTRMETMLRSLASLAPSARLIVSTLLGNRTAATNTEMLAFNAGLPGLVTTLQGEGKLVTMIDTTTRINCGTAGTPQDFADATHPNRQGYHKMAELWLAAILPYL